MAAPHPPAPESLLSSTGLWAYAVIAVVLLLEAVPLVGAMIPAQLFMLGAGFLAGAQHDDPHRLHLSLVILVGFVSLYVADIISFALGRRYGLALVDRLPRGFADRARALSDDLARHAGKTMVLGKFLGPARALTPPLAGAGKVSWPRFLAWEAVGAFLWVALLSALGLVFGRSYKLIEKRLGTVALVLMLGAVVGYIAVQRYRATRKSGAVIPPQGPPP